MESRSISYNSVFFFNFDMRCEFCSDSDIIYFMSTSQIMKLITG